MIRINLATRKQAVTAETGNKAGGAHPLAGLLTGAKNANFDQLKELPLKKVGLMIVAAVMATYLLDDYKNGEILRMDALLTKGHDEQSRLQGELAKTKGYEDIKKSLDADEIILHTKIDTIQKLLTDRQVPPKMMITLSSAIPQEVWLSKLKIDEKEVVFRGGSMSFNAVSDFMKSLSESAYFTDVRLQGTKQERDETGADVAGFEILAKRR